MFTKQTKPAVRQTATQANKEKSRAQIHHEALVKISEALNLAVRDIPNIRPKTQENVVKRITYPSKKYVGKNDRVDIVVNDVIVKTWKLGHKGAHYEEVDIASKLLFDKLNKALGLTK